MRPAFKKYLSLFLLAIFAWPFIEKGIHDAAHADDEHCSTHTAYHLHDQQHQCSICDFDCSSPIEHSAAEVVIAETAPVTLTFYFHTSDPFAVPFFAISPRGPPAV
jgi:hypothetical protein